MKEIHFTKMHGLGNDYIYVNLDKYPIKDLAGFSQFWSVPKFGIGADGLVTYQRITDDTFRMRIFNADGSEGLMCGNAARCIGKLLYEKGLVKNRIIRLETKSGTKVIELITTDDRIVSNVKVDMGKPSIIQSNLSIRENNHELYGTEVSIGNYHFVSFLPDIKLASFPLKEIGPIVETHPNLLHRVNFEVATIESSNIIRMRVWEIGSGITMACGTGACATAIAAIYNGYVSSPVQINMDGGSLSVEWSGNELDSVFMIGDATFVFDGVLNWKDKD